MAALRTVIPLVSSIIVVLGAGFPLTFSLYATSFQSVLGYTQTEVNTVNIANIVGQFIGYPLLGTLSDRYGANVVAGCGALFTIPGLLFAASAYEARSSCFNLSAAFFCIGVGSTCGYITSMSTCARALPERKGLAISMPVCAYGLATLIFSVLFQQFFSTPDGYDIPGFWRAITVFVAFASVVGVFGMRVPRTADLAGDERRPLLADASTEHVEHADVGGPPFFGDVTVLLYALGYVLIAGSTETLVGNLGSILESITLAHDGPGDPTVAAVGTGGGQASTAVSLFALTSTLSRLVVGVGSDWLARNGHARFLVPVFLVGLPLAGIFLALAVLPPARTTFLAVAALNGWSYGSMYCSGPGIAAEVWGLEHFGRNWGTLSYAPLVGSTAGSYLYAALYDAGAARQGRPGGLCVGRTCYRLAFSVLAVATTVGLGVWVVAWRLWRRRGIHV